MTNPEVNCQSVGRRELIKKFCGIVSTSSLITLTADCLTASEAADDLMPKAGDLIAYAKGDKKGQTITLADLTEDAQPILARPKDAASGALREKSPKSLLLIYRANETSLTPELAAQSASGVMAFSALCTHLGCPVEEWDAEKRLMRCPCHKGVYDPRQKAAVVSGPPPKPLPFLPLKLDGQSVVIAAAFSGRVGAQAS